MDTCASQSVFLPFFEEEKGVNIPDAECGNCSELESRLTRLENLLEGTQRYSVTKTDSSGGVITATYIGTVERS